MILVVGYMVALTIFVGAFVGLLNRVIDMESRAERKQVAMNLAEAGLDVALVELSATPREYRGESNRPLGDGRFSVAIVPGGSSGAFTIGATGEFMDGEVTIAKARITADVSVTRSGEVRVISWKEVKRQ